VPPIGMSTDDWRTNRADQVRHMLLPLKGQRGIVCEPSKKKVRSGTALVAHDGVRDEYDYRACRFRSRKARIEGNYFEIWVPDPTWRRMYLKRAYLTLLLRNDTRRSADELLCIHCDPDDASEGPTRHYKRGPHLHVRMAQAPLPRCHFALCLTSMDNVVTSAASLTAAFGEAALMISHEVLERF